MRRSREERVLLVSMPFGALERPSLALGLLAAHCRRADIACDTRYLNMLFADRIGVEDYLWITGEVPYTAFAGDWVFAEALHGPRPEADESYVDRVLVEQWHQTETDLARLGGRVRTSNRSSTTASRSSRGTRRRSSASRRSSSRTSPRSRSRRGSRSVVQT